MTIKTVGVVGAGQMGNGIAHVFALAGFDVAMSDISEDALTAAMANIQKGMERQVSKNLITEAARAEALSRITTTQDMAQIGGSNLVIEAATENEDLKNALPHAPTAPSASWASIS